MIKGRAVTFHCHPEAVVCTAEEKKKYYTVAMKVFRHKCHLDQLNQEELAQANFNVSKMFFGFCYKNFV